MMIGASLSEPHTSVTSLRTCVCMFVCLFVCLLAWTDHLPKILNQRIQIFHEDRYREASEGLTVRVQRWRPGAKTTEIESTRDNLVLICASTEGRQAAHRRYKNMDGS